MTSFTDSAGREWKLTIDLVEIRRVREETGVRLGVLKEIIGLAEDIEKFGDVLWCLVTDQAKAVKTGDVTREQFLRSLIKDVPGQAHDALAEAYLFFCPTALATAIREEMAKGKESRSRTSSGTDTSSAESAESIPTPAA